MNKILHGDCLEMIPQLDDSSIQLCVTSPPYANQRSGESSTGSVLYEGIPEQDFPDWTVKWMSLLRPKLKPNASVFIVIRPHVRNGQISDYTIKTRLALRADGWIECDELIWHKPDAPPLGSNIRPRRTWESVHWFSNSPKPYTDLYACGKKSDRIGGYVGSTRFGEGVITKKGQITTLESGISRVTDVITGTIGSIPRGVMHPAMYPGVLPETLVRTFSKENDVVFDPFMGSGQTALAAISCGRNFMGVEKCEEYVKLAEERIKNFSAQLTSENPGL